MKLVISMMVLMLTGFPAVASAEFYKYVDEQGNVHYTDDLSDVPAKERPKADRYDTSQGPPSPPEQGETKRETEGASKGPVAEGDESTAQPSLRERGAELDAEYQLLMKERDQLNTAASEPMTPAARAELAEKIKDFNKRMEDYEKRRIPFNEEAEAYNAGLKEGTSAPKAEEE